MGFGQYSRGVSRRLGKAALALALVGCAQAGEREDSDRARSKKRWIASWIAVAAANALDVHSSLGHGEANPLYRGRNGRFAPGKAMAIKGAISGGMFLTQMLVIRSNPQKNYFRPFVWTNAITAGALGGVAAHNYSLPRPQRNVERVVPAHLAPPAEFP